MSAKIVLQCFRFSSGLQMKIKSIKFANFFKLFIDIYWWILISPSMSSQLSFSCMISSISIFSDWETRKKCISVVGHQKICLTVNKYFGLKTGKGNTNCTLNSTIYIIYINSKRELQTEFGNLINHHWLFSGLPWRWRIKERKYKCSILFLQDFC